MKINKTKEKVKELLECIPMLRDDDNKLLSDFWEEEIISKGYEIKDALILLYFGSLTSPESIRRSRQKLQEEYPHLRGEKYKARHKHQEDVKKELGYKKL